MFCWLYENLIIILFGLILNIKKTAIYLCLLIAPLSYVTGSSYDFSLQDQELKNHLYQAIKKNHHTVLSYYDSRKELFGVIHLEKDQQGEPYLLDIYCLERYNRSAGVGHRKVPNHTIVNTEHVWPQSRFSSSYPRRTQKTDLHHLYPTNSKANSTRGNLEFGLSLNSQPLDNCEASQTTGRVFTPPYEFRGNIARAIFYFSVRYRISLSVNEEAILREWHQQDPVDEEERLRNAMIEILQGNRNPFIDHEFLVDHISKF